ncbi:protein kinase domain-containing protein [endosymbiont of Lamellibrachia barhami]|uniref:protein kinase domain-containing protein n=1 Tax=endosymbiont of Lamellibrachia barhami TaxID=205975 RepID=UPI001FEC83AE|nr:protein kinase [endosymbiont of Lamellibrachia barhami]
MTDFRILLNGLSQGSINADELIERLSQIAEESPEQIPALIEAIDEGFRVGHLPPQIHAMLLARIKKPAPADAETPVPPPGAEEKNQQDESTRIVGSDDATRVVTGPGKESVIDDEATRIATGPASRPPVDDEATRIATGHTTPPTSPSQTSNTPSWASTSGMGTTTASHRISHEPAVGDILNQRFELVEEIGRGGMGVVFKALDQRKVEAKDRKPYVALKLLNESFKQHAASLMALQREARKAQDLKHPDVIGIFDFDKDEHGNYFIAMEFLEGSPLDKVIKKLRGTGMPPEQALKLITEMSLALAAAHNHKPGIIHSDFKPGNVFLTQDGEVKVFDFGIARAAKPKIPLAGSDVTAFDASTLGALTPTYASLGMLEGQDPDPRDDIYALAIVAYELFTGGRPFGRLPATEAQSKGLRPERVKGLSRRQWKGLQRGLAFKREDRTPSAEKFLDELTPKRSRLPLIAGLSVMGAGLLGWLLVPDYLERQRATELAAQIERAKLAQIPLLLENATELSPESQRLLSAKAVARLIGIINQGTQNQIREGLQVTEELPPAQKREVISSAREAILTYYISLADAAFAPQEGSYDYVAAERQMALAGALFTDSIQVFRTTQRMEDARNDLLNRLDSRFNENLSAGRLLPDPVMDDMADVLGILRQLDPEHPLLTDPRLANAYSQQASDLLAKNDVDRAAILAETGLKQFPDDIALENLAARIHLLRNKEEAQALLVDLHRDLKQRLPGIDTLDGYRELEKPLEQLRLIQPGDPLLSQAETGLRKLLQPQLERLISQEAWSDANTLLKQFAGQLSNDYMRTQQKRLLDGKRAPELLAQEIAERRQTIEQLTTGAKFTAAWEQELDTALNSLNNLIEADDPWLSKQGERIGRLYLQQAEKERSADQFAKAGALLSQGKHFAPTITNRFKAERGLLTSAESAWEQENRERIQLARIEGAKQSLLTQAKANDVTQASKTLQELQRELPAADPFLQVTGPEAIGRAYLRLAKRRAKRDDFVAAIKLVRHGLSIAPEMPELTEKLGDFQRKVEFQKVGQALKKQPPKKLHAQEAELQKLRQKYPEQYPVAEKKYVALLIKRIENAKNPAISTSLLAVAKQLFPDNRALTKVVITKPLKPSIIAARGLAAVDAGRLNEAKKLLQEAKKKESGHPDLARLGKSLKVRQEQAKKHFSDHQTALKTKDRKQAIAKVEQAIELWNDNATFKKKLKALQQPVSKDRCNPKYAGYGKRSSKFRCYDLLDGKQRGPIMVVVPAGAGNVTPYAIGRYEISVGDYNTYCRLSGKCKPRAGTSTKLPLNNISLQTAQAYAKWLTGKTGHTYRLPREDEWLHAAKAKGRQPAGSDFNCLLRSGGSVVKGGAPIEVNVAPQNAWGLFNFVGNLQEWVNSSNGIKVRGGHFNSPADTCSINLSQKHGGSADKVTGFRLLREIKG